MMRITRALGLAIGWAIGFTLRFVGVPRRNIYVLAARIGALSKRLRAWNASR